MRPDSQRRIHSTNQQSTVRHSRSISISVVPCSGDNQPYISTEEMVDAFSLAPSTPSRIPASKIQNAKMVHTPPLPSRKLLQLLPISIGTTRRKSHDSQAEPANHKWVGALCVTSVPKRRSSHRNWIFKKHILHLA